MKKTKFTKHLLTFAIAATAIVGVQGYTPKAEEQTEEVVATDTDAEAVVAADELTAVESRKDTPHYSLSNGGTWDGTHYVLNGTTVYDAFFYDGEYTYYLQFDGTPMKNRLTYHPDGDHVIYFDENGHEVFSDFAMVKQSITGEPVDDMCFFDVYGHMYKNKLTYDKTGTKIYYVNKYGVIERNGWFWFPEDGMDYFNDGYVKNLTYANSNGLCNHYGYANADGSLMTSQFTYNWNNKLVYIDSDGTTMPVGMYEIGGTYYVFNFDCELTAQYSEVPETYSVTRYSDVSFAPYYYDEQYEVYTFDGNSKRQISYNEYLDGKLAFKEEWTYDDYGNVLTDKYYSYTIAYDSYELCDEARYHYTTCFYDDCGRLIYEVEEFYRMGFVGDEKLAYCETSYEYYDSGRLKRTSGFTKIMDYTDESYRMWTTHEDYCADNEENIVTCERFTSYDVNGNPYATYEYGYTDAGVLYAKTVIKYDTNTGAEISREVYDAAGNRIG